MKLFQDDLESSFEDMYDVATLEELNVINMEINALTNTLDISSNYLSILENNKLSLESMLNDNVSANTLKISIENINMIYNMLGINNIRISNESIDDMVKISIESIGESISKGYEAVKKVVAKIIEAIKNFFKKIWNFLFGKSEKVAKKEAILDKVPNDVKEAMVVVADPKASDDKKAEAIETIVEAVEEGKPETNPCNISTERVNRFKARKNKNRGKKVTLQELKDRMKTGDKDSTEAVKEIENIISNVNTNNDKTLNEYSRVLVNLVPRLVIEKKGIIKYDDLVHYINKNAELIISTVKGFNEFIKGDIKDLKRLDSLVKQTYANQIGWSYKIKNTRGLYLDMSNYHSETTEAAKYMKYITLPLDSINVLRMSEMDSSLGETQQLSHSLFLKISDISNKSTDYEEQTICKNLLLFIQRVPKMLDDALKLRMAIFDASTIKF